MIYTYIALGTMSVMTLVFAGAYHEERKAHKNTVNRARQKLNEQHDIIDILQAENSRLALVAKAYRTLAVFGKEK